MSMSFRCRGGWIDFRQILNPLSIREERKRNRTTQPFGFQLRDKCGAVSGARSNADKRATLNRGRSVICPVWRWRRWRTSDRATPSGFAELRPRTLRFVVGGDARVRQDALFPEGARRTRHLAARASVRHIGKGRGIEPCLTPAHPWRPPAPQRRRRRYCSFATLGGASAWRSLASSMSRPPSASGSCRACPGFAPHAPGRLDAGERAAQRGHRGIGRPATGKQSGALREVRR